MIRACSADSRRDLTATGGRVRRTSRARPALLVAWFFVGAASAQPPEAALLVGEAPQPGPLDEPLSSRPGRSRLGPDTGAAGAAVDAITSETALLALQREVRQAMLDAIGGLPETRTPLNARVVGASSSMGTASSVSCSRASPASTSLQWSTHPTRNRAGGGREDRRRPAVLLACGHSPVGKAHPGYQEIAARLARRGYVAVLGPDRPGRAQPVLGRGARPQPLQPRVRRARRAGQFRDARRDQPGAVHGVGRHPRHRLPALARRRGRRAHRHHRYERRRASSRLDRRARPAHRRASCRRASPPRCRCAWPTGSSRTPTATPSRTRPASSRRASTTRACCCSRIPGRCTSRPRCSTSFPIEGTRQAMREVAAVYRRFGHGDAGRAQRGLPQAPVLAREPGAAFGFLDRVFGGRRPRASGTQRCCPRRRCAARRAARCAWTCADAASPTWSRAPTKRIRNERTVDIANLYPRGLGAARSRRTAARRARRRSGRPANPVTWRLAVAQRRGKASQSIGTCCSTTAFRRFRRCTSIAGHLPRARSCILRISTARSRLTVERGVGTPGRGNRRHQLRPAWRRRATCRTTWRLTPYIEATAAAVRLDDPVSSVDMGNHVYNGLLTGRPYLVDALRAVDGGGHSRPTTSAHRRWPSRAQVRLRRWPQPPQRCCRRCLSRSLPTRCPSTGARP